VAAVFAANGHFGSVASFTSGYRPAMVVSAGISLLGAVAAVAIGRKRQVPATAASVPAPVPVAATNPRGAGDVAAAMNAGADAS
jgi:Flp pilus assembly protein protease CpaA